MSEPSGFFVTPSIDEMRRAVHPELLHSSECGLFELWCADKGGRKRVYKALKQQFRGDSVCERMLRKEFEIGYSLVHPNVCEVIGFVDVDGLGNCIEMEWVDGESLENMLGRGRMDNPSHIIGQLCDALSYIHSRQVIHRDLKPSNILVARNGATVKLIDFGLSDTDSHTLLKEPGGSADFASPELIAGDSVDCRADIWSLGCIISILMPSKKKIIRKCLQRNPDRRYATAGEVKAALFSPVKRPIMAIATAFALAVLALSGVVVYRLLRGSLHTGYESVPEQRSDSLPSGFPVTGDDCVVLESSVPTPKPFTPDHAVSRISRTAPAVTETPAGSAITDEVTAGNNANPSYSVSAEELFNMATALIQDSNR